MFALLFAPLAPMIVAPLTLFASAALASDPPPATKPTELRPAPFYSGQTPIDLKHGLLFNNGTYGKPNPAIEKFAEKPILPGLSDKPYPYTSKANFMLAMNDTSLFVSHAIANWERKASWPEAEAYAKTALEAIRPALDRFNEATKKASGAGQGDWEAAQADARRALIELRAKYWDLHRNVR